MKQKNNMQSQHVLPMVAVLAKLFKKWMPQFPITDIREFEGLWHKNNKPYLKSVQRLKCLMGYLSCHNTVSMYDVIDICTGRSYGAAESIADWRVNARFKRNANIHLTALQTKALAKSLKDIVEYCPVEITRKIIL